MVISLTYIVGLELWSKFAPTFLAASIVTLQVALVPLQAPLQPVKFELLPLAAVKVTEAPLAKFALQAEPQSIPAG